jgi:uncharacterized membrane protein
LIGASVNLLAVLVAAIVGAALGSIWYSPLMFIKKWMTLTKVKMMDLSPKLVALSFISSLITAYILAVIIGYFQASVVSSLYLGFLLWLGFVATTSFSRVLWENSPVELYILNNAYNLLQILVMAIIIALWV